MELKDLLRHEGLWEIGLIDKKTGKVFDVEVIKNLIVGVGKERAAKLLNGISTAYFQFIAIGTGTAPAAIGNTSLETEFTRAQAITSYEADYKSVYERTFDFTEARAITEAGLFDQLAPLGSTMFNRIVFSAKNVDSATSLYIKVIVQVL